MSIRTTAKTNTSPIDALLDRLDQFNEIVGDVAEEVYQDWAPEILVRLRQVPGPSNSPVIWESEKQRRAYFATSGFGRGTPTVRTGSLADAWTVTLEQTPGVFQILISNPKSGARYVYGSLAQNFTVAASRQSRQHKATGWPLASEISQYYIKVMTDDFAVKFKERLGDLGTVSGTRTRAYTGG